VVLVARRPDGRLLLHTKAHFPPGTYRFPSGGIQWAEGVLEALAREQGEELGLHWPVMSMPGLVRYTFQHGTWTLPFASYVFLLRAAEDERPVPQDPLEAISGFRWIPPADLPAVADHLHHVVHAWTGWGRFRAIPHEVMAGVLLGGVD
jgi:8-oxo-dGTP pyrophosphatase MutT (NUDIX family)